MKLRVSLLYLVNIEAQNEQWNCIFSCIIWLTTIDNSILVCDSFHCFFTRSEDAYSDTILGYANSIRTIDGGTHIDAMKASITRTLNSLGKKSKVIKVFVNFFFPFILPVVDLCLATFLQYKTPGLEFVILTVTNHIILHLTLGALQ